MSRKRSIQLFALVLSATLGWSAWAACAEGAMTSTSAQMACCKNGHRGCVHVGSSTDCCKTDTAAAQFTTVKKPSTPHLIVLAHVLAVVDVVGARSWHPGPAFEPGSPPGTKHPTYLRLSTLRV
jgi:hypothetical protein